ncbi:hypothetical protein Mnod_3847 [Methylobacterium nodulans ORS 2060]|uniref:Uncharacterized protein n=2 Tax=Methylobacterium nodulans TaxID=114616 RepID=B8ISA7_METNO|nr:hypothetical protein Mnod_3847 [Methylobacterium nodulans ORS 2060]
MVLVMSDDRDMQGPLLILLSVALLTALFVGAAVLLGYGRHQFQHHDNKAAPVSAQLKSGGAP